MTIRVTNSDGISATFASFDMLHKTLISTANTAYAVEVTDWYFRAKKTWDEGLINIPRLTTEVGPDQETWELV